MEMLLVEKLSLIKLKKVLQPNCRTQLMEHESSGPMGHQVHSNYYTLDSSLSLACTCSVVSNFTGTVTLTTIQLSPRVEP